jgi:hypothetical protein
MKLTGIVFVALALTACHSTGEEEGWRYGALMAEAGQRFELIGRAEAAGRVELAQYELDELQELFEEDFPHAEPPRVNDGVDLESMLHAMLAGDFPKVKASLVARDRNAFDKAYRDMASSCTGCHIATGHGYLEISGVPGTQELGLAPAQAGASTLHPTLGN